MVAAMDRVDPATRSRIMASVRGRDTKPERTIRRVAHSLGYRFRLHRRDLPGCPDLVFPRLKLALFVHGCFWHSHEMCRKARPPTSNTRFWLEKLSGNRERNRRAYAALELAGWRVAVIWECELGSSESVYARLREVLPPRTGLGGAIGAHSVYERVDAATSIKSRNAPGS